MTVNTFALPRLYKVSNIGKVSEWDILVCDEKPYPCYKITYGYKDGAKQTQTCYVKAGKNIGRANETTALEQCHLEAQSKWVKQRDRKGYTEHLSNATATRNLLPMLAKSYEDQKHKLVFPCYAQPKLDGIRCLAYYDGVANKVVMLSRQGKPFKALGHLENQLHNFLKANDFLVLDGELYVHGEAFQNIVSAIKRDEPSPISHLIEYHVYDIVDDENGYETRQAFIKQHVSTIGGNIKVVPTWDVKDESQIDTYWQKATNDSYEGIMLRNKKGNYKCDGRSSDLLKYKKFMDEEFEIVDAYENKGSQAGQCTLVCVTKDGTRFGVKPEGSASQRRQIWEDFQKGQLTGKFLTVRFFSWTTSKNPVPRFPIGVIIRDYENP